MSDRRPGGAGPTGEPGHEPDTPSRPDGPAGADARGPDPDLLSTIAAALGDRRQAPRIAADEPCTVFVGSHVQDATLRDVSPGGAMLHGVRGMLVKDLIRLRLPRRGSHQFVAEVRGISLLGVHVAIVGAADQALWLDTLRDVLP